MTQLYKIKPLVWVFDFLREVFKWLWAFLGSAFIALAFLMFIAQLAGREQKMFEKKCGDSGGVMINGDICVARKAIGVLFTKKEMKDAN